MALKKGLIIKLIEGGIMSNSDDFEMTTNKFEDEDFPGFDFSIPTEEELAEQKKKAAEELMHNGFLPKN